MAEIRIKDSDKTITTSAASTILNALLKEGVAIPHQCGGKAQCGTCRIEILSGNRFLSPVSTREKERLEALKAGGWKDLPAKPQQRGMWRFKLKGNRIKVRPDTAVYKDYNRAPAYLSVPYGFPLPEVFRRIAPGSYRHDGL